MRKKPRKRTGNKKCPKPNCTGRLKLAFIGAEDIGCYQCTKCHITIGIKQKENE